MINFPINPTEGDSHTDPVSGSKYIAAKGGTPAEWVGVPAESSGGGGKTIVTLASDWFGHPV